MLFYFVYGREKKVNDDDDDDRVIKFTYLPEVYFQALLTRITGIQGYGSWFSSK